MAMNNISTFNKTKKAAPGELLHMYRSRTQLTQAELAVMLGLKSFRMLQYWEGGYSLPKAEKLKKLIEVFVQRSVFVSGKELEEARQLWSAIKNASDSKLDSFTVYPIFDEHWLESLLQTQSKPASETSTTSEVVAPNPTTLTTPAEPAIPEKPRSKLPVQLTAFVGREQEVEALCNRLRRPEARLLTVTGAGGTGKTRLAVQAARELLGEFEDGAFFVALASISDPTLVASAIAQVLGVKEASVNSVWGSLVESLKAYLRDRHLLLVLDNFEQVIEASALVKELLEAAPMLKVLVTSREVLHLYGEHQFELSPLAPSEAVALFVQRAQAVKPDFILNDENRQSVTDICQRLDGLPLAIELAAARIKLFSPSALLSRLTDRLGLLVGGARDLPRHQQTLRDTLEWSYRLLSVQEQRLFAYFSIFRGGCQLEAVEAIYLSEVDSLEILELLSSLVDKSILRQRSTLSGNPRFSMLEIIREYSLDRLKESGKTDLLRWKHAVYYMNFAQLGEQKLAGAEQTDWIQYLETEHNNIRAAFDFLFSPEAQSLKLDSSTLSPQEVALRMAGAMWRFWWIRGYFSEGRTRLEKARQEAEAVGLNRITPYSKVLSVTGALAYFQGDYTAARSLYEVALPLKRELGDKAGVSSTLNGLGLVALIQGDYAGAKAMHEESLALKRELGDKLGSATSLNNLGLAAQYLGHYAEAEALHQESLAFRRAFKDKQGIGHSLINLGEVAHLQKNYAHAQTFYEESLALRQEIGDRQGIAAALNSLALVAIALGDFAKARQLYEESLTLRQEIGDKRGLANCLVGFALLAQARANQSSRERAVRLLAAVNALIKELGGRLDAVDHMEYEQSIAILRNHLDEATFTATWNEGSKLELAQALAYAHSE